jgi:protein-tyrosine phosphatase
MLDFDLYGGKRGYLEHAGARVRYALGIYRKLYEIDWTAVARLVFVCTGNICRSPYAGARARALGVPAVSLGLQAAEGAPVDPVASRNALLRGLDLSGHRSARAQSSSFASDDLIVVFEPGHVAELRRRSRRETPVSLLGIWARPARPHIQDPYGRSDRYFQECFSVIDANVAALVGRMVRREAPRRGDATGKSGEGSYNMGSRDGTPF